MLIVAQLICVRRAQTAGWGCVICGSCKGILRLHVNFAGKITIAPTTTLILTWIPGESSRRWNSLRAIMMRLKSDTASWQKLIQMEAEHFTAELPTIQR